MFEKISQRRARNKERRAIEAEMRRAKRLPPGQRVTLKFPVLHIDRVPPFDPDTWQLRVWGAVDESGAFVVGTVSGVASRNGDVGLALCDSVEQV